MSKSRHYEYWANAATAAHGLMRCALCHKNITEGQYRYHETPNAFVTVHRACCSDDAGWKRVDADRATRDKRNAELLADALAFRSKWGVCDLDDLISDLSDHQQRRAA